MKYILVHVIFLTTYLNNDYDMHCILNNFPLCFMCCTDFSWHLQDSQKITAIIENYCDIKAKHFPSSYQVSLYWCIKQTAASAPRKTNYIFPP